LAELPVLITNIIDIDNPEFSSKNAKKDKSKTIPLLWFERVSQLQIKFDFFLLSSFKSDPLFELTIGTSMAKLINSNVKAVEYCNNYVDFVLKKAAKDNEGFENDLNVCIALFKFCEAKDLFERLYRNYLGKRLLNMKLVNMF
jgi:cullin 3